MRRNRYRVGLDSRLALFDSAGIGGYIRNLATWIRKVRGPDAVVPLIDFRDSSWTGLRSSVVGPAHSRLGDALFAMQLSATGVDLLHAPDHVLPPRLRTPSILTIHDLSFWVMPETHSPGSRRYYEGCRESLHRADAIICVSEFTRDELFRLSDVDRKKVHVAPSGLAAGFSAIDPLAIEQKRGKYGLAGRYAIFVGTLGLRKNVVRLIEAFSKAEAANEVTLALAGAMGNAGEEVLRTISRAGLEGSVRLLGSPPDDDMAALIAGADFLALVSLYEGFGHPVLEAMACGTPCLISNRRPLTDLAGPAGFPVDPLQVEDIADGIDALLEDGRLRSRLGSAGPGFAARYSWKRAATRTCEIYEKVLN